MRIAIIVISCLLWLWFLGCTFTWKFGKVLLVEGTGLNSIEFAALLRDKFNRINITAGFLQSLPSCCAAADLFDQAAFPQQQLQIRALGLFHDELEQLLFLERELGLAERLLVDRVVAGAQQLTHVILAAPDLRHAAVNVQQRIDRFHTGAHGIFGGEDRVARSLGELADEGEVHGAVGHDLRAVGFLARLEERIDIRHEAGGRVARVMRQRVDAVGRNADVIEPLAADLLAGAVAHGLFHIVAGLARVEGIQPDEHRVLILRLELRLTVDRPGEVPVVGAVLHGHDAARCHLARARVALADAHNVPDDLLVGGCNGRAHPVGRVDVGAELVRIAEFAVLGLRGDRLPHIPRFAEAVLHAGQVGRVGLVAVAGGVGAAAVGDEHQVVLGQVDGLLPAVLDIDDLPGDLFAALVPDDDVFHVHAVFDPHAVRLKVFHQRQDHALILVVFGEAQGAEVGQAVDVMHIAAEVALHLQRARPALEGEHRLPIEPEIRAPEGVGQDVGDLLILQILLRRQEELGQRHGRVLVQLKFFVGVRVLAAFHGRAAEGIVRVVLVEPIVFVEHRDARRFERRHVAEGVPHDLEMVVHLAAAAHKEALGDVLAAVAAAAGKLQLFQQMDVLPLHPTVADEIEGGRQAGKTGADDIGRLFVDVLRLFGVGKRFISSG